MKFSLKLSNDTSMKKRYSKNRREEVYLQNNKNVKPQDLAGIYRDLAEIIGIDDVIIIYEHFKGQQVSFPTRLYTKDFTVGQVISEKPQPIKKIATQYGYSERRLRQIIQEKK